MIFKSKGKREPEGQEGGGSSRAAQAGSGSKTLFASASASSPGSPASPGPPLTGQGKDGKQEPCREGSESSWSSKWQKAAGSSLSSKSLTGGELSVGWTRRNRRSRQEGASLDCDMEGIRGQNLGFLSMASPLYNNASPSMNKGTSTPSSGSTSPTSTHPTITPPHSGRCPYASPLLSPSPSMPGGQGSVSARFYSSPGDMRGAPQANCPSLPRGAERRGGEKMGGGGGSGGGEVAEQGKAKERVVWRVELKPVKKPAEQAAAQGGSAGGGGGALGPGMGSMAGRAAGGLASAGQREEAPFAFSPMPSPAVHMGCASADASPRGGVRRHGGISFEGGDVSPFGGSSRYNHWGQGGVDGLVTPTLPVFPGQVSPYHGMPPLPEGNNLGAAKGVEGIPPKHSDAVSLGGGVQGKRRNYSWQEEANGQEDSFSFAPMPKSASASDARSLQAVQRQRAPEVLAAPSQSELEPEAAPEPQPSFDSEIFKSLHEQGDFVYGRSQFRAVGTLPGDYPPMRPSRMGFCPGRLTGSERICPMGLQTCSPSLVQGGGESGAADGDSEVTREDDGNDGEEEFDEEDFDNELLIDSIQDAYSTFEQDQSPSKSAGFESLLASFLDLTESTFGFIATSFQLPDSSPCLKTNAITNVFWNDKLRSWYAEHSSSGVVFTEVASNGLFGRCVLEGQGIINNEPTNEQLPRGHPRVSSILCLPLIIGPWNIGLVVVANRIGGYHSALLQHLLPLATVTASLIFVSCFHQHEAAALSRANDRSKDQKSAADAVPLDSSVENTNSAAAQHFDGNGNAAEKGLKKGGGVEMGQVLADGVVLVNEVGEVVSMDPAARAIFGFAPHEKSNEAPLPKLKLATIFPAWERDLLVAEGHNEMNRSQELIGIQFGGPSIMLHACPSKLDLDDSNKSLTQVKIKLQSRAGLEM